MEDLRIDSPLRRSTSRPNAPAAQLFPRWCRCGRIATHIDQESAMSNERFPIDLNGLKPLKLDPGTPSLSDEQRAALQHNIQLARDAIVFFTALAGAKGLSGHTGGA